MRGKNQQQLYLSCTVIEATDQMHAAGLGCFEIYEESCRGYPYTNKQEQEEEQKHTHKPVGILPDVLWHTLHVRAFEAKLKDALDNVDTFAVLCLVLTPVRPLHQRMACKDVPRAVLPFPCLQPHTI